MSDVLDNFAKDLMKLRDDLFEGAIHFRSKAQGEPWDSMTDEQRDAILKHELKNIDADMYVILALCQGGDYTIYDKNKAVDLTDLCTKEYATDLHGMLVFPSEWIERFSKYPHTIT